MKNELSVILVFMVISMMLGMIVEGMSYMLGMGSKDSEKLSAYECGFDAFEDASSKFDVSFYLIGMLFIVFDLEATFLFPWVCCVDKVGNIGLFGMLDFLFELLMGLVFAWSMGSLSQSNIK